MKKSSSSSSLKIDRKTVERNRRNRMKGLCFNLASLIPPQHFKDAKKEMISQQDQLDYAASYIKQQKERVEILRERKEQLQRALGTQSNEMDSMTVGSRSPLYFELKDLGSSIEVTFVSKLKKNFMLYQVISILQEEGSEVVSANFSTVGDKIFHSLHAQVRTHSLYE
ncbi:HLH domain-containing protein [Cephalotus follicularis]|uniref:HLH domain-containing protein n=1 Tax=Cephalotus follicularis TaxID=3775 RepID=A0A1Q3C529_CEPFO|nr:HLH domain-containing protein [Cephalotus follicularis]